MLSRWIEADELNFIKQYENAHNKLEKEVLRQAYATRLLGAENDLTMHGGGNTSFKTVITCKDGSQKRALFVKASGTPLSSFLPEHFVVMDLGFLEGLKSLNNFDDDTMAREFKNHQLSNDDLLPSIESLMHAFIPARIVDHTHPAAILKIVNRIDGGELLKECFGNELAVIPYARMGFDLAKAVFEASQKNAGCKGVVMRHHGLIVWGEDPRAVYERTISVITKAEDFLPRKIFRSIAPPEVGISVDVSIQNYEKVKLFIKERLTHGAFTLLNPPDILELINSSDGKAIVCDPPLTPDYPMYARISLQWADGDINSVPVPAADTFPRAVVHPKIGVLCYGADESSAKKTADFVHQALSIRRAVFETGGTYESLAAEFILDMQYRGYQQSKTHLK
ncbi:MAG: class II aldolase/adducin family protein [Chitinispirillia bacterium]|nr:class II aldolase/adducin family protein [Chitinispirillia bacterium]